MPTDTDEIRDHVQKWEASPLRDDILRICDALDAARAEAQRLREAGGEMARWLGSVIDDNMDWPTVLSELESGLRGWQSLRENGGKG